jgi:DNA-binding MarR family transcriptional regulator
MTTSQAADPIEAELVALANDLVGRIWGHFTARAAELNLSLAEAKALQHLEPGQAMPMRALAARLHANPSNVTVVVARLQARNLLERQVSDDRRIKGARLTAAGEALKRKLEARLIADHPLVRGLSPADQQRVLAILRRLT